MPLPMNQKPKGPKNWGKFSKTLSFWVLITLLAGTLFTYTSGSKDSAQKINYTDYRAQLDAGNVKSATFQDGLSLIGELKTPISVNRRPVTKFKLDLPVKNSDEELTYLRSKNVIIDSQPRGASIGSFLLMFLPYIIIFGIWIIILRQMQAGGAKAFSFGKSKAKLLTANSPKVTFADVAGADEAKVELEEIIEFLKDPQKFTKLGGRLPKGALLVGPPGTGKTLLARAVAGEAGRPFFSMSGSDFVEMFVGVGASRVRDLFEQGKAHAPCIIFIDEIDAVGRHRGAGLGGGHDEREQTLNQLLVEMDGFESNDGVILIAATNRPDVLDPALLRPGRFDRRVVVSRPDVRGREGILQVHTRKIPLSEDVDISTLARATPGFSGADLANLVNEAALLAARHNQDQIDMIEMEEAVDRVIAGPERKTRLISDKEKEITAYHEAGHAIVGALVPEADPVHKITIIPRGQALGVTMSLHTEDRFMMSRGQLMAQLAMMLGGRAAERVVFDEITTGASNDLERVTQTARQMVTRFGMSEKLGPMALGHQQGQVFMGRDFNNQPDYSDEIAF